MYSSKPIFSAIVFLLIIGCAPDPHRTRARFECASQLKAIYKDIKSDPPSRFISDNLLSPYDISGRTWSNTKCPVVLDISNNKEIAPYWLVFAVREREENNWISGELTNEITEYPLIFTSESISQGGLWGEGNICFSNGKVKLDWLPVLLYYKLLKDENGLTVIEIEVPNGDPRYPYGNRIDRIRAQLLNVKQ